MINKMYHKLIIDKIIKINNEFIKDQIAKLRSIICINPYIFIG